MSSTKMKIAFSGASLIRFLQVSSGQVRSGHHGTEEYLSIVAVVTRTKGADEHKAARFCVEQRLGGEGRR